MSPGRVFALRRFRLESVLLWLERKALVLAALPAAVYFALTALFGVNVIVWDEWSVIPYLVRFQTGTLTVGDLWLDGNMHRRLFPNLIRATLI